MAPPILTLALLVLAFVVGYSLPPIRKAALVVLIVWAVLMPALFVGVGVADDGDVGAFVFAATVVGILALALTWLGSRMRSRRSRV